MRPIQKASVVGIITVFVYLLVVVVTTPALDAIDAISAAFQLNSFVIIGMGIGIGLQVFLSEKSKQLGCKLNMKKKAFGGNSSSTAATSFFFILLFGSARLLWVVALCIVFVTKCCGYWCLSHFDRTQSNFVLSWIGNNFWIYRTNCIQIKTRN